MLNRDPARLKLCFQIKLIGGCSMQITPIQIDEVIGNSQNAVLFICSDGYVFEKRFYDIKYTPYRLIIPPYRDFDRRISHVSSFRDDQERYKYLKIFKNNLMEYTRSGVFGHNPYSRVLTYADHWFVY